jgi:hypothetical protein
MGEAGSVLIEGRLVSQPPAGEHLLGAPRPGEAYVKTVPRLVGGGRWTADGMSCLPPGA